ncbi:hypothetical protein ACSBR1_009477 [Camellia fascicularis]
MASTHPTHTLVELRSSWSWRGKTDAVALAALSSQNPGAIAIANAVFGSNPKISDDVLAKAFQVDKKVVDHLKAQFWWSNN